MFGFSMVQMVRANANKLDRPLRDEVLNLYKPFKWTPCVFHRFFENTIQRWKKFSVIIEFEEGCYQQGCQEVNGILNHQLRCRLKKDFHRVSCCSAEVTPKGLEEMLTTCNTIKKVHMNREVHALLDVAVESIQANNIKKGSDNLTGKGVNIAIIDTGIHPHQDVTGRITEFVDFINDKQNPYDDNGHGTHCAGDAAGDGSASSFQYVGPAPEANLFGVKVLDKIGSGSLETVMQGVDWCITYNEEHPDNPINIISMSLGSTAQPYEDQNKDPMVQIVEEAWKAGIAVCVAAGNSGPEKETIASPGVSDQIITVGALDDRNTPEYRGDDDVAPFSSRGPTIYGGTKPDILAPGVNIVSLRSPNSYLDKTQKTNRIGNDYFVLSGTSMATPICAGVVALIKESDPGLKPDDIKKRLMEGADMWEERDPNIYGAGYLNAGKSIQ